MGLDSTTLDVGGDTLNGEIAELCAAFDDTAVIVLEQKSCEQLALTVGDVTDPSLRRPCTASDWPPEPPPPQAHVRRRKAVYAAVDLIEI
jgi:hypothetical protein